MTRANTQQSTITTFLRDHHARCPGCRYDLRDCQSAMCPECGLALELMLRPRSAAAGHLWWLCSLFGALLSTLIAGYCAVQSLLTLSGSIRNPNMGRLFSAGRVSAANLTNWRSIACFVMLTIICLMMLAWVLTTRHRMTYWPLSRRAGVGLACLMSPMSVLGLIALAIAWLQ